jgi:phosphohistidine phosphatase SixA
MEPRLTERGQEQAHKLARSCHSGLLVRPQALWSSPRRRAIATLQPTSQVLGLTLNAAVGLDERQDSENAAQFRSRIEKLINEVSLLNERSPSPPSVLFLCTHYDWIEESLSLIPSDTDLTQGFFHRWPPGQFMDFHIQNHLWHLKSFSKIDDL